MARATRIRPFKHAAAWEDRFWRGLEAAVPREVQTHLQAARTEILRAVKSVIDDAVTRSERVARGPRAAARRDR